LLHLPPRSPPFPYTPLFRSPPSRLREGLKPEIDQVVLRAMKKRPDQRYGTWAQFSVELSKAVALVLPTGAIADSEKYLALSKVEDRKSTRLNSSHLGISYAV